jgi:zinc transporter
MAVAANDNRAMTPLPEGKSLAFAFDGGGGARALEGGTWDAAPGESLWLSLDPLDPAAERWLLQQNLSPVAREVLLGEIAQTRVEVTGEHLLLALQANPGDENLRQNALRVWVTPRRIVTIFRGQAPSVTELLAALSARQGPANAVDALFWLAGSSNRRGERAALDLEEELADLEYGASDAPSTTFDRLRVVHRKAAGIRRGKVRERDAVARLVAGAPAWFTSSRPEEWVQLAKRTGDLVALLDGVVERCHGLHDYIQGHLATVLNDRLYVLTLISVIMLPLTFVTGLLGVNVAGIPGKDSPWAFPLLCLFMAVLAVTQFLVARRLNFIPGARSPERSSRREQSPEAR